MNTEEYANYLLATMANAHFSSGRKFINCRCPECGDSVHRKSAHMYIYIPWQNEGPSWYYCHKCNSSGIIDYKKLLEWDIYDQNIAVELQELNTRTLNGPKKSKYFNRTVYNIFHSFTRMDEKSEEKRQYICNRIGYNLSFDDLARLKIIVNLNDILAENHISKFTREPSIVNDLDREFIGFLSVDNAFLNMRRTCQEGLVYKSIDKRYVNYKIYDKQDTTQRFYSVPTRLNLNTPFRIPFHISEGPFDILSIYLNLRNQEPGIYTSVAGSNYIAIIMFFLIDLRIPNIELHLYPDNDKFGTDEKMWNIINKIPDHTIPVYVHRNMYPNEKDFGVPRENISERIIQFR